MPMKSLDKTVELSAQMTRSVFKINLTRFAVVLLAVLASFVAVPNAALAAPPQHRDQVPGFYRLKVGDLEVTALYDSKGQKILFWGDTIHAQRVQLQHPEITVGFDIDQTAAAATRNQLLPKLAGADVLIASPHSSVFPPMGRLRKEGGGYNWVQVVFTDRWDEK